MSELAFPLSIRNGRLLFDAGSGRALLASASPVTVSPTSPWTFLGRNWAAVSEHAGLDAQALGDAWGVAFDVLVGGNVLSSFSVSIERATSSVVFASDGSGRSGTEVELVYFMGIPMVDVTVAGKPARLFVDTSSRLSFLDAARLAGIEPVGRDRDLVPGAGEVETPIRSCEVEFGGDRTDLHFGEAPRPLAAMLAMGMAQGVLGTEILATHDLTIDGPGDRLLLRALSLSR
jgi:hypothetical protein